MHVAAMTSQQTSAAPTFPTLTSLSNNALYAPLNTYIGEGRSTTINSNLKEKSLYSFLESVSQEYHNSRRTLLGFENAAKNGGQGLKARHFETKLGQRALTLIKGGIRTEIAKSTSDIHEAQNTLILERKRANRGVVRLHGSLSRTKRKKVCKSAVGKSSRIRAPILVGLNHMWNQYAQSLLSNAWMGKKKNVLDAAEAASLMATAELVGSHVEISKCKSCQSYVGRSGFIVDVTRNTWRIALPQQNETSVVDDTKHEEISNAATFKCVIIPKQGSCIVLKIRHKDENSDKTLRIEING